MTKTRKITRRSFLKRSTVGLSAVAAAPYVVPSAAMGLAGATAPSERVTLGCIGVGGKGTGGMRNHMRWGDLQVVAVSDPNALHRRRAKGLVEKHYAAQKARGGYSGCAEHVDFRDLVARDDIDAVLVGTPDHWHVPASIGALRAGKDVYCEKPLSTTVAEGRALVETVRQTGRIFQHGTQLRSLRNVRFACELVQNGRIGKLERIRIGSPNGRPGRNVPPQPIPATLDYDLWLGPAQWAPYNAARIHPFGWYFISDYSPSGWVAGFAVHDVDIALWGMGADAGLRGPVEIEGTGVYPRDGMHDTAVNYYITYKFANGVTMQVDSLDRNPRHGVQFLGPQGWVYTRSGIDASPKSLLTSRIGPEEIHLYASIQHERNFIDCIKTRRQTLTPAEVAHRANSLPLLGDIAMRLGRKLTWDPVTERFVNDLAADCYLRRPLRSPWHL